MDSLRISSTELARATGAILNRVRFRGESFIIEKNGKEIAVLSPREPRAKKSLREVLGTWLEGRAKDPGWGRLLEEVNQKDRPLEDPWGSPSTRAR